MDWEQRKTALLIKTTKNLETKAKTLTAWSCDKVKT